MKEKLTSFFLAVTMLFVVSSVSNAQLNIKPPRLYRLPQVYLLPDLTITEVVKEFMYDSWPGTTVYRYYVLVENHGGPIHGAVKVSAFVGYAYADHTGHQDVFNDSIPGLNGDETAVVTFMINERRMSGGDLPSSFVATFTVDPGNEYAELDENNNGWACNDSFLECDTCQTYDCPY